MFRRIGITDTWWSLRRWMAKINRSLTRQSFGMQCRALLRFAVQYSTVCFVTSGSQPAIGLSVMKETVNKTPVHTLNRSHGQLTTLPRGIQISRAVWNYELQKGECSTPCVMQGSKPPPRLNMKLVGCWDKPLYIVLLLVLGTFYTSTSGGHGDASRTLASRLRQSIR